MGDSGEDRRAVVADHIDSERLAGLVMIGVDEVSWRKRHRHLTCVADHVEGGVVWAAEGRSATTLQAFFEELGEEKAMIQAVSIDMSAGYEKAVRAAIPHAEVCFDPFHVVKLAGEAVDKVRRAEWNVQGKSKSKGGRWVKGTRWALLKAPENRTARQDVALAEVQSANKRLYRTFLLKEQLRELYHHVEPAMAAAYLEEWLAWAQRSKLIKFSPALNGSGVPTTDQTHQTVTNDEHDYNLWASISGGATSTFSWEAEGTIKFNGGVEPNSAQHRQNKLAARPSGGAQKPGEAKSHDHGAASERPRAGVFRKNLT